MRKVGQATLVMRKVWGPCNLYPEQQESVKDQYQPAHEEPFWEWEGSFVKAEERHGNMKRVGACLVRDIDGAVFIVTQDTEALYA